MLLHEGCGHLNIPDWQSTLFDKWMISCKIDIKYSRGISSSSRVRSIDNRSRGRTIGSNPMDVEDPITAYQGIPVEPTRKRRCCDGCDRPWATCLCSTMPPSPLRLSGHVFVLRHPNEQKKNLATIPVLMKCLKDITVVHGRRIHVRGIWDGRSDSVHVDRHVNINAWSFPLSLFSWD